jgi:diguanylate cyclase (GGDEF)-like protein
MISIRESLNALEKLEEQNKLHVRASAATLKAVEYQIFPLFPEAAAYCLEDWRQVSKTMDVDIELEVLASTPRLVERVLFNFARESRRLQWQEMTAVKEVISSVGRAFEKMQIGQSGHSGRITALSSSLDAVAAVDDPAEMRSQLARLAVDLRDCTRQLAAETQQVIAEMEGEISHFRSRLAAAEEAASTDPLTGLANRRELDRRIAAYIDKDKQFSVLMFDIDEFKSVNDRFGHDAGDALLCQFGRILTEQVRPADLVARWGGDEFVAILKCPLHEALQRVRQISDKLAAAHTVSWNGRTLQLRLHASAGAAEHLTGESAADLFHRVDAALLAAKQNAAAVALQRRSHEAPEIP